MTILKRIYHRLKKILGLEQSRKIKTWNKNIHEKLRYTYDLNGNSIIFDLGGYEGQWTSEIFSMYCPSAVYVFEPVKKFADGIVNRFKANKKIHVFTYGLGGRDEKLELSLSANGSSVFIDTPEKETIAIKKASNFFKEAGITNVDLMKINIEGGEYDLLEHLIETGLIKNIKNIQVQFHDFVPNARERMEAIQTELKKTHHTTYSHEFIWENWERTNA